MRRSDVCVLHVVEVGDREALETLCRTTHVIATAGVEQVVIDLACSDGPDLVWSLALAAEVRPLRCAGRSLFDKVRALQSELTKISGEREVRAVHLHGLGPCLLGSRALRNCAPQARVLYSPHMEYFTPAWLIVLLRSLLPSQLERWNCAAITASLTEAQLLSRLLKRSAEILPYPVSDVFFEVARRDDKRPHVLADGAGAEAVDVVTRLSILLNSREARVPMAWLGAADARLMAKLEAASVQLPAIPDDAERAKALAGASAFMHLSAGRLPLAAAQAMAAGVPCLVSDSLPHRALIRHGETGFICTSERDFLEKLVFLLRERAERERMGDAARADAERWFTLRHFERAVLRAYGFPANKATRSADAARA